MHNRPTILQLVVLTKPNLRSGDAGMQHRWIGQIQKINLTQWNNKVILDINHIIARQDHCTENDTRFRAIKMSGKRMYTMICLGFRPDQCQLWQATIIITFNMVKWDLGMYNNTNQTHLFPHGFVTSATL